MGAPAEGKLEIYLLLLSTSVILILKSSQDVLFLNNTNIIKETDVDNV